MKLSKSVTSITLMLLIVSLVSAQQIGIIPNEFVINAPNLPLPTGQEKIGICNYELPLQIKGVQVYSHEPLGLSQGNITYEFQITMPKCEKSFRREVIYNSPQNPVAAIQLDLQQTLIQSIAIPQPPVLPIATGISPTSVVVPS